MTNKPTDADIIKALECCINADCLNCPNWTEELYSGMCNNFLRIVLDLITRFKAENERLQMGEYRHIGKTVKNAYREGIEDAFDRLRNIISLHTENHISLGLKDIDLIESEMVGENDG